MLLEIKENLVQKHLVEPSNAELRILKLQQFFFQKENH